jgi:hypothetical protein
MLWVGFKLTIPAFQRAKTVQSLDRAATVIGFSYVYGQIIIQGDGKDLEGDGCSLFDGRLLLQYELVQTKENHFNQDIRYPGQYSIRADYLQNTNQLIQVNHSAWWIIWTCNIGLSVARKGRHWLKGKTKFESKIYGGWSGASNHHDSTSAPILIYHRPWPLGQLTNRRVRSIRHRSIAGV